MLAFKVRVRNIKITEKGVKTDFCISGFQALVTHFVRILAVTVFPEIPGAILNDKYKKLSVFCHFLHSYTN